MIVLPENVKKIIEIFRKNRFEAYAVGGSVRDMIIGIPTKSWDLTTNAKPEQILGLFPDSFYDNQFGTVGIKIYKKPHEAGGEPEIEDIYEVTTYRSESGYSDFRHPDTITWGTTLEGDLTRRDFTIDAIATDGTILIDPFGGQTDVKNAIVRAVGDPDTRFKEDALRLMRGVRIATQLGFRIEEATRQAMKKNAALMDKISCERIRDELVKILESSYPSDGILLLKNCGVLSHILPELERTFSIEQKSPKRHHIYDVGMHSIMALKHCPSKNPIVRLATLLHDIGKAETFRKDDANLITFYNHEVAGTKLARDIVYRLHFSKKDSQKILLLIRWHQFSVDERQTDSAIRRIIRRVGPEHLTDMLDLRIGDRLGGGAQETSWRLELFKRRLIEVQKQPFTVVDLKVNGFDVMELFSCKPGPVVGTILKTLFSEIEAGTLPNDRDMLILRMNELRQAQ